jgi:extracellular factor (EF) 3-hydroxypalmitic acid methyl ester biosynthesis protein
MRSYEELGGARGREIFYRAERLKAAELFKHGRPALLLDTSPFALQDVSISGLGARAAQGTNEPLIPSQGVAIQLRFLDMPLFEARGEIARVEPTVAGVKVGVRLIDRSLDIPALVASYKKARVSAELDEWTDSETAVMPEYRRLCADVLYLLRRYRMSLGRFEATRPDERAAADMLAACEERVLPRWRALWHHGNELVGHIAGQRPLWQATKLYTEAVLTPDFILGAFARRCYEKPLGYPGDYQAMTMAYDWRREGLRLGDQLMHRVGLEVGECIANRMIMMRQAIARTVSSAGDGVVRIASLGCGPAREVVDYLTIPALPRPVEVTLIDQDHAALASAYERALTEIMRHRGRAKLTCLHTSFTEFLKVGALFDKLPPQQLIYSVGLIDYLTMRLSKALVAALYERLAPGGQLIIGNMKAGPDSTLWPVEFITDWSLTYRTPQEMLDLGADLPDARLDIMEDRTGRVCILVVQTPGG